MDRRIALAKHYALRAVWSILPVRAKAALYKRHRARHKLFQ